MLSFEDAGYVLDDLADELPEGIFDKLNGGVSLIEDELISEDGRYTLGCYYTNEMGRYIELYYGSFVSLYGEMDDELFRQRLKKTLHHELTHHIESMAGDRSLEHWDERQSELCGFNGIEVKSILFVDDDDSALAPAAAAIFEWEKTDAELYESLSTVTAGSAAAYTAAGCINSKAVSVCAELDIDIASHIPQTVTRELIEAHSVCLCMTLSQADELSARYQDLEERIMCLAEDDIIAPPRIFGWKKSLKRLYDEVLAVIDELREEEL